jgi:TolB-like protein/DNA-binding winged helix-turn-helix (wHTH) protein/Flp pilus assembly protein TadD
MSWAQGYGSVEAEKSTDSDAHGKDHGADARFCLGDWVVHPARHHLSRDGNEVRLEPKVMRVLVFLAESPQRVVKRAELEAAVWPGMIVTDDAVTNTVIKLRRALGDDARNPQYIETIAKSGYRLIADVGSLDSTACGPVPADDDGPGDSSTPERRTEPTVAHHFWSRSARLIPVLLVSVPLIALTIGWWLMQSMGGVPPPVSKPARPVVAVLPFKNLSGDPERGYFADGITEDLITDLSKLSGLQVVARNTVMAYRDGNEPASRIGRELGADFLVRGSVQRSGQQLRINVRLIDPNADRNRWAERYDRKLADIFRIQDEIASHVVTALQVELAPGEQRRLVNDYVTSVEAYDAFLRGLDLLGRRASADNPEARSYFREAIGLEPRFARAYAGLAMTYALRALYGHGPEVLQSLDEAERLARQGLAIDENMPQLRYTLGLVEMYRGNLSAAIAEVSRAIELRPSYADGYGLLAWIMHFAGRPHDGLNAMQQAVALNPRVPALYLTVEAALHYQLEDIDQALRLLQASVEISPNQLLTRLLLSAVYAAAGDLDAARWEVEELHALEPGFELELDYGFPIRDPQYRRRFVADLVRAGLADR